MKKLLYVFILFCTIHSFSQQEASKWYFGQGAALDFSSGTPTNIGGSLLNTNEGCSSFADSSGNTLFYIGAPNLTGVNLTIWDANNNPMPNANVAGGTGLNGDASSSQSALTVPDPNDPNRYFIFTVGAASSGNSGFWYYTLDMSLNGGMGDIVGGATPLHGAYATTWTEKVTAVKGSDCNTFWVVSQFTDPAQPTRSVFWSYEVTATAPQVSTTPVVSIVDQPATDVRGYLKVSPDGSKLATAHYAIGGTDVGILALYDFDNSTGEVNPASEEILIDSSRDPADGSPYGLEFSSNSEKLYTSTYNGSGNKVFQFDLNRSDIAASKTRISERNGRFRGALQMALNGKIYATVPFSYSNGTRYLDVIENPSDDAVDVIYTQDAVDLGTNLAMQGLPPFLSSIFDEIELTGTDSNGTVTVLNGLEFDLCVGDDLVVDPAPLTGTPTYAWTLDGVAYSNSFNLSLTNLTTSDSGEYELVVTYVDACGFSREESGSFTLTVHEQPTAGSPILPIQYCDDDNDSTNTMNFDLTDREAEVLDGQSKGTFEVLYYRDMARTDQITGADITAFASSGLPQTIYASVSNLNYRNCVANTEFDLEIYESAFPLTAVPLLGDCDNTSVGTDTDGLILFNLTDRATDILNGQSATDFTLTYFTDAAYTTQIPENVVPVVGNDITSYQNDPSLNDVNGRQTIYVRMTNNVTASFTTPCYTDTSFEIEVFELPTLLTPSVTLILCNDDLTLVEEFNLRLKEDEISANFASETFTYYETFVGADTEDPLEEIANPIAYPNQVAGFDTVWVRVETSDGCHRVAEVNLDVNPSSSVMNGFVTREFSECDEAPNDTDGIATFDFSSVTNDIQTLFGGLIVDVFYYETEAQANQGLAADQLDPTSYENTSQDQLIWVQIVSEFGSDCLAKGEYVQLHVNPIPEIDNTLTLAPLCDDDTDTAMDDTNGTGVEFDLESLTDDIENLQPDFPAVAYNVTYHLSAADAVSGAGPQSSPFRNTSNGQIIYVRVENDDTTCVNPHMSFTLDVNPLPIIDFTNISLPSQCDNDDDGNDTNGIGVEFDLGSLRDDFENLQVDFPAVGYNVTYHATLADAEATPALNPLPDLYANTSNNQTVFVRVENDDTGCVRIEESPILLVVNPLPIISTITVDPRCDDTTDTAMDDTNGIVAWNLDDYVDDYDFPMMQTVAGNYDVTFHTDLSATPGNQIMNTSSYENMSSSSPQPIFVRVTNTDTSCTRVIHGFDLVVNPLPDFELMTDDIVCENILPHSISVEDPLENDYLYEWFNTSGVSVGTDQTLTFLTDADITDITRDGVDYTVTVTNPTTLCERSKTINLRVSDIAELDGDDIISIEFNSPGNGIEVIVENFNLGSGDYQFSLEHEYDSRPWQDEPIFEELLGGIYTLVVEDKNGCGSIDWPIVLLDYPKFLTPNNDGYNDVWQLIGLGSSTYTISPIQIYDRFGKIVAVVNPIEGEGWDGLYNNEQLPSSDYWFSLELTDNQGGVIRHRGHFSLVRR